MITVLRQVTAVRYITPLREGGSLPGVVEADDLGTYVVKFAGAGQGRKALVAEVVSGQLARALGLPVPDLVPDDAVALSGLARLSERAGDAERLIVSLSKLLGDLTKEGKPDVFAAMGQADLLVHHPYDSFSSSVERLVEQAVDDPDVLAIKLTVYRTSDDSALVPMLIKAAERGKGAGEPE